LDEWIGMNQQQRAAALLARYHEGPKPEPKPIPAPRKAETVTVAVPRLRYKGVVPCGTRWEAWRSFKQRVYAGRFHTPLEAAKAIDGAVLEKMPNFDRKHLNFPNEAEENLELWLKIKSAREAEKEARRTLEESKKVGPRQWICPSCGDKPGHSFCRCFKCTPAGRRPLEDRE